MAEKQQPTKAQPSSDVGQAEVQANMDEATEKGYIGEVPDKTPNSAYTVQGVTSGAKTPETDPNVAEQAKKAGEA